MSDGERSATRLGAFDIGCVVVGGIIGVGIFFTPATVAAAVDTEGQALLAWGLGGAMALVGALVFAGLSRVAPGHGGMFAYIERAFGAAPAFSYGWANWLVIQAGALCVVGLVMVRYLDVVLWGEVRSSIDAQVITASFAILLLVAVNVAGLRFGRGVQNALTVAKTGAVFAMVALALLLSSGDVAAEPPAERELVRGPIAALAAAMLPVLFSFGGWQQGSFVARAARRPRDVPLGILWGVAVVVLAYLTINVAFLDVLGLEGAARSSTVAEDAMRVMLAPYGWGDAAGRLLSLIVVVSALGIMNTICMAPPFVLHAMARRGLFLPAAGRLHPTSGTPVVGVLVQGGWAVLLLLGVRAASGGDPQEVLGFLLNGVVFVDWLFFGACGLALLRLAPGAGHRVLGGLFALAALAVTAGAVWTHPVPSRTGLLLCAAGLPFFFWMRRR